MRDTTQTVLQRRYDEVFDALYRYLEERRCTDPNFTPAHIKGFLKDAYVRLGNNWTGKGALFETTQNATIAAYETFLANWTADMAVQGGDAESDGVMPSHGSGHE
jgi:hypothetical protein